MRLGAAKNTRFVVQAGARLLKRNCSDLNPFCTMSNQLAVPPAAGISGLGKVEVWQNLFENWPDAIKRNGSIVTVQGDAVPFVNFMVSDGLLLVERDGPDVSGARRVIVGYDSIAMVKLTSAAEMSLFESMGFQPAH